MEMKKLFVILIGIALTISMAGVVSAGEITPESDKTSGFPSSKITVSLSVGQEYEVSIPVDFALPADGTPYDAGDVNVEMLSLISTEVLFVYVNSEYDWYLVGNGQTGGTTESDKIPYRLECTGGIVATYGHDTPGDKHLVARTSMGEYPTYVPTTCTFVKGTGVIPKYGSYSDTLTFTVEISSSNSANA